MMSIDQTNGGAMSLGYAVLMPLFPPSPMEPKRASNFLCRYRLEPVMRLDPVIRLFKFSL
jgi:hypothetical protein